MKRAKNFNLLQKGEKFAKVSELTKSTDAKVAIILTNANFAKIIKILCEACSLQKR